MIKGTFHAGKLQGAKEKHRKSAGKDSKWESI